MEKKYLRKEGMKLYWKETVHNRACVEEAEYAIITCLFLWITEIIVKRVKAILRKEWFKIFLKDVSEVFSTISEGRWLYILEQI